MAPKSSQVKSKKSTKSTSRSKKAGLILPVGRIHRLLRKGRYAERIGASAPVAMTAVLEYVLFEIMEVAQDLMQRRLGNKSSTITNRDIFLAASSDTGLAPIIAKGIIPHSGAIVHTKVQLLSKSVQKSIQNKKNKKLTQATAAVSK